MLRMFIARHGQNLDNENGILNGHRDLPLTKLGISQAQDTAQRIKQLKLEFSAILTSPLLRAQKTATIIAETNNSPKPIIIEELIERDFGVMSGVAQSKIEELCAPDIIKTNTVTYFLSPKNAETFPDLMNRARELIDRIKEEYKDGDLLLVTHGDIGKMIYAEYYNLDWRDVLRNFHFGNSDILILSPDSPADKAHLIETPQYNQ